MDRKKFIRNATLLAIGAGQVNLVHAKKIAHQQSGQLELMINAGVNGNSTKNLLMRLDSDVLVHKPTLTIMMVGTNDMNDGKYVPVDKFKENLITLSAKIKAANSQLLMMTILPFYEPYLLMRHKEEFFQPEGVAGRRNAVNDAIKEVAKKQGVSLFDGGTLFEKVGKIGLDKESLLRNEANSTRTDGVHPTHDGYRFLALGISQHILFHELPFSRIVCFGDSITKGDGSIDGESYPAYLKKLLE
jgi:lysophospholipase L1-like esterase